MTTLFASLLLAGGMVRGPMPILSTPYFADGSVDYESLAAQTKFVAKWCPGVIWGQSSDSIDLVTYDERLKAFDTCAATVEGSTVTLALGANGTNTAHMLEIAAAIERTADRHPTSHIAIISRPPNDARSEEDIERAWDALGAVVRRPVIFQTHGAKNVPEPSVELMVRLATRHPDVFGWIKEESPGDNANVRMVQENAAKPAIKNVLGGWGGWQWLYQLRQCGCGGLVSERAAYAPILGTIWRLYESGERGARLSEAYAMYRLLIDQRNFPEGLRGYSLYLLQKEGLCRSLVSRQYHHREVTEGGMFGWGDGWKLETVELTERQKAELDALYDDMMDFVNARAAKAASPEVSGAHAVPSLVRTGPDRNATALQVPLKKIGCLRPKSVREVGPSNFTLDGAPVDRDFVDFDKYRDYLEPLGVSKIRILAGWAKSEREKGKVDVAWLDRIVDWCLAHGIEPLLELSYGNPIYPGAGGAGLSDGIPNTPEGLREWDRWVDFLANHYKGRVKEWAMWNEPDNRIRVNTPDMIAAFNVRSAKILKKHMPDCRLHGLSLGSSSAERLELCLRPMGEDVKLFDTFIYHGYVANPDLSYETDAARKAVVAKYAPHARLRQGENGAPSEFNSAFALNYIPWSELSQAKYDLRRALGDLGNDLESGLFCIVDINYGPPTYPVPFSNRKGYLRLDSRNEVIQVKRAYYAIQNMVSVFNASLTRVAEKKVSTTDPSLALFEYRNRSGEPLFVFWEKGKMVCRDRVGGKTAEYDAALDPQSGRPGDSLTTREVVFEWGGDPFKEPVWVDLLTGWVYEIPAEDQIRHADGITFVRIPAYDSPCFVTERAALDVQ